jgi:hypothetical protein
MQLEIICKSNQDQVKILGSFRQRELNTEKRKRFNLERIEWKF